MGTQHLQDAAQARVTPQSEPIPGSDQVENYAGGYAWEVGTFDHLRRFLVLGTEGGTFYAGERDLTRENLDVVRRALAEDGPRAVELTAEVSERGLAPRNDQAILVLAMACAQDRATQEAAFDALPRVCRTATHLFLFATFVEKQRGWGRALRRAVAAWYTEPRRADFEGAERAADGDEVAYASVQARHANWLATQVAKYRERHGWSHRGLLNMSHAVPPTRAHGTVFQWAAGRGLGTDGRYGDAWPMVLEAAERARMSSSAGETAKLIRRYEGAITREMVPSDHLSVPEVWSALLEQGMPLGALVRNLANMTRIGLVRPGSWAVREIERRLQDREAIKAARLHPFGVLTALLTYRGGHGLRGSGEWEPVAAVSDALDAAFYMAFESIEPSGKRTLVGLDVSGSMELDTLMGVPGLTPRVASAAMALATASADPVTAVVFSGREDASIPYAHFAYRSEPGVSAFDLSPRRRLDDVTRELGGLPFGRTDCALPMLYALEQGLEVDAFVIYTDNETWYGDVHPAQALRRYREQTGIPARLVVSAMTSTGFSIADPQDPGMLDAVGLDSSMPALIADFASGRV